MEQAGLEGMEKGVVVQLPWSRRSNWEGGGRVVENVEGKRVA